MADRILGFCEIVKAGDRLNIPHVGDSWVRIDEGSPFIGKMCSEVCEEQDMVINFKRIHEDVYVYTVFLDAPLVGWGCDRNYNYIDDMCWRTVRAGDIIETDNGLIVDLAFTGRSYRPPGYYNAPLWAKQRIESGARYATYWTNYYKE